jgi:peptidyl-prolyl cis-trans isomerase D
MATLQKIRNRAGILIAVIIGVALLAFVLGDMFNSGQSLFSNSQYEIAEIAGKSIAYRDYLKRVDNMASIYKFTLGRTSLDEAMMDNIRNDIWEKMVQDFVMQKDYKELGISVSGDELFDMFQGTNPHPLIRQIFTNPETGTLNRTNLFRFLQQTQEDADSEEKKFRIYLEDEIYRYTIFNKYNNLIKKGLNVTSLEAKKRTNWANNSFNFDYIVLPFNTVPDSAISVSEKDITNYYMLHKSDYEQDESRDIRYVYFEVVPSEDDYKDAEHWINEIEPEFREAGEIKQFINFQSDVPYNDKNYSYDSIPELFRENLFNEELGTIYGPYFEDESYKLAKLAAINYLPDSMRARHILLRVDQQNARQMFALADSLENLLKNGADFVELAKNNSADQSAEEGGDLGWFTENDMVNLKSLSDSCFFGKPGDIKIVTSQLGIHIVEILKHSRKVKKVQVGILVRKVEPSETTDRLYYSKASEFAGLNNTYDKFNKAIEEQNLMVWTAKDLTRLEKDISGLETPRSLVKWAYNASEYAISPVFKFGNKYVIAVIDKVREKGYAPLEDIRAEIEIEVKKQKKAQQIVSVIKNKLTGIKSLEELADALNTNVQTATNVRFISRSFGTAGVEPDVIATAYSINTDIISDPVIGNNGVYVVTPTMFNEPAETNEADIAREKQFMERNFGARVYFSAYDVMKENAKIEDLRSDFY